MKSILVVLDGLNMRTVRDTIGYLPAQYAPGEERGYQLECELPALPQLLYGCILTGVMPVESDILIYQMNIAHDKPHYADLLAQPVTV